MEPLRHRFPDDTDPMRIRELMLARYGQGFGMPESATEDRPGLTLLPGRQSVAASPAIPWSRGGLPVGASNVPLSPEVMARYRMEPDPVSSGSPPRPTEDTALDQEGKVLPEPDKSGFRNNPVPSGSAATPEDKRRVRIQHLEALKGVAKGLNTVGEGIVNAATARANMVTHSNVPYLGKAGTPALDQALAEEHDRIPPAMIASLKARGFDLPDDATFSTLMGTMPAFTAALQAQARKDALAQSEQHHQDTLAETRANREQREAHFQEEAPLRNEARKEALLKGQADISENFQKQPYVRKLREEINAAETAIASSDTNAMGQFAASIKAARASGEVGALSESDKQPFRERQGIAQKFDDLWTKWTTGQQTPELREQLKGLLGTYSRMASEALSRHADLTAQNNAGRYGMDAATIRGRLMGTTSGGNEWVTLYYPDGSPQDVHRDDVQEAIRRGMKEKP